jgi:hypothetical protein
MDRGYPEFGYHLNKTGRPMLYSCSWPVYQTYSGMTVIVPPKNLIPKGTNFLILKKSVPLREKNQNFRCNRCIGPIFLPSKSKIKIFANKKNRPYAHVVILVNLTDFLPFSFQPNYTAIINSCNLWRNFDDIQDSWQSVASVIDYYGDNQDVIIANAGPGHWNDPDMVRTYLVTYG